MNRNLPASDYAADLVRRGKFAAAARVYRTLLETAPDDFQALHFLGLQAFDAGQIVESIALLTRACAQNPAFPAPYVNLGRAQMHHGDFAAAVNAFDSALARDACVPLALLGKGVSLKRLDRLKDAAEALFGALTLTQQNPQWTQRASEDPDFRRLLAEATAITDDCRREILYGVLEPVRERHGQDALKRIVGAIGMYLREQPTRYPHPQQHPTFLFIPGLPARPFYEEHSFFPWLGEAEAATADVRAEMGQALAAEAGFHPVVENAEGAAANYWREVNNRMSWNGFYFYRHGKRHDDNCARCPKTAALLDALPLVREPGHSPEAHFSVLQPGAHIPIHTGVVNARLVVHLPLIIPPACGIRIAGETHGWNEGECLVFDDTFEHEAWNSSEHTRVVLIFDIWNPYLSEAEREALSAVVQTISATPLLSARELRT
jgi:aspartate beta-hydroxylase